MERGKAYRRHQAKRYENKYKKIIERFKPHSDNIIYNFNGQSMRGEEGREQFINYQAKCMRTTAKRCSCYLCSVSTKRDGYKYSDKQRIEYMEDTEFIDECNSV